MADWRLRAAPMAVSKSGLAAVEAGAPVTEADMAGLASSLGIDLQIQHETSPLWQRWVGGTETNTKSRTVRLRQVFSRDGAGDWHGHYVALEGGRVSDPDQDEGIGKAQPSRSRMH